MAERPPRARIRISIAIPCAAWLRRVPDARARCRRLARAALAAGGFDPGRLRAGQTAELSLVLGDDVLLHRLNREFRGQDKPTNVLSFPGLEPGEAGLEQPVLPLGDVAIAYETTVSEARAQGKTLAAHLSHLVVHGVLHVLGYDHLSKVQANDMETLETVVLARFGLSDPYRARVPPIERSVRRKSRGVTRSPQRAARSRP